MGSDIAGAQQSLVAVAHRAVHDEGHNLEARVWMRRPGVLSMRQIEAVVREQDERIVAAEVPSFKGKDRGMPGADEPRRWRAARSLA